jgi:hypothetical protein
MNLFEGLSSQQVTSLIVAFIIFNLASGLCLISIIVFGVRAGMMAPAYTRRMPPASDLELMAFFLASVLALATPIILVFKGLGENYLDDPTYLVIALLPTMLGGLLFLIGVALAVRTVRARRTLTPRP